MNCRKERYGNDISILGCGKCKKHCPQGIDIPEELKNVKGKLEGPVYKIGKKVFKMFKI